MISLFVDQKMHCGYLMELPLRGHFSEYLQCAFLLRNMSRKFQETFLSGFLSCFLLNKAGMVLINKIMEFLRDLKYIVNPLMRESTKTLPYSGKYLLLQWHPTLYSVPVTTCIVYIS